MLGAVKASDIVEVVWVSLVAGVLVCFAYALVVLGTDQRPELRARVERVTHTHLPGALRDRADHLLVKRVLDEQP